MTAARLLRVASILVLGLGLGWTFVPDLLLDSWGGPTGGLIAYVAQRYGVLFVGYAVMFWVARDSPPSHARLAILVGGLVACLLMAVMSLVGVVSATIPPVGLAALGIETALAAAFGWVIAQDHGSRRDASAIALG